MKLLAPVIISDGNKNQRNKPEIEEMQIKIVAIILII